MPAVCDRYLVLQYACLVHVINVFSGHGNFGQVRLAVLRRRGFQPARLVAVKELLNEASEVSLLNEAKLMQDIPHHRNVVYLFGVTEQPFW